MCLHKHIIGGKHKNIGGKMPIFTLKYGASLRSRGRCQRTPASFYLGQPLITVCLFPMFACLLVKVLAFSFNASHCQQDGTLFSQESASAFALCCSLPQEGPFCPVCSFPSVSFSCSRGQRSHAPGKPSTSITSVKHKPNPWCSGS